LHRGESNTAAPSQKTLGWQGDKTLDRGEAYRQFYAQGIALNGLPKSKTTFTKWSSQRRSNETRHQ